MPRIHVPLILSIGDRKTKNSGTRIKNLQKSLTGITGIRVPEKRDTDGTRTDTNPKIRGLGTRIQKKALLVLREFVSQKNGTQISV